MADQEWKLKGFWMKSLFVISSLFGIINLLYFVIAFLAGLIEVI